jgi:hypothetical protein
LGHLLWLVALWGRGACWSSGMGIRKSDKHQLLTQTYTNQTSWLVRSLSAFGARTNHRQTWTQKTHHGPNLGETTTFTLIVYYLLGHETSTQMSFCPGTLWGDFPSLYSRFYKVIMHGSTNATNEGSIQM